MITVFDNMPCRTMFLEMQIKQWTQKTSSHVPAQIYLPYLFE